MPEPMKTPTRSPLSAVDLQAGAFHRLVRRRQREMDEAPHFPRFFLVNELQRVEVFDFGGEGDGKGGGVEAA